MEETVLKTELHDKIEHADLKQLQELNGLITNYFNGMDEGWDSLSEYQQSKILKGLEEADAGLGTPFDQVTETLRKKYGLNG